MLILDDNYITYCYYSSHIKASLVRSRDTDTVICFEMWAQGNILLPDCMGSVETLA